MRNAPSDCSWNPVAAVTPESRTPAVFQKQNGEAVAGPMGQARAKALPGESGSRGPARVGAACSTLRREGQGRSDGGEEDTADVLGWGPDPAEGSF